MMRNFVSKMALVVLLCTSTFAAIPVYAATAANDTVSASELCEYATSDDFIGLPYVWAGESMSGFDCSGFTRYVYGHFGIELDHYTGTQVQMGTAVDSINDLKEGDLVFFYSDNGHVGIYIGNNQFVHSSSSGLMISDLTVGSYYYNNYSCARRILEG